MSRLADGEVRLDLESAAGWAVFASSLGSLDTWATADTGRDTAKGFDDL